jgi:chromate reductase, NAD(P)H dehydrogenase (quinone)
MSTQRDVAVLVGSLRKASFSRKIAKAVAGLAPPSLALEIVEIGDLPLYNQDLDDEHRPPAAWTIFRDRIRAADAVVFMTPEYNRSVPGVLKNALDVGSRPFEKNAWDGKPAAVVSITTGKLGAFGANHHLRQSFVFLNVPALTQPEVYIGEAKTLFDDKGTLTSAPTRELLEKFVQAFDRWITTNFPR